MNLTSGKWMGFFSYERNFEKWTDNATPFTMDIEVTEQSFSGWIMEGETFNDQNNKEISVTGYVLDKQIYFTKTYIKKNYQVEYKGRWEEENSWYKGMWLINHYDFQDEKMTHYVATGVWGISRADQLLDS